MVRGRKDRGWGGGGGEDDYLCSTFRNNAFFSFFLFFFFLKMGLLEKFCQYVSENEVIAKIAKMKCAQTPKFEAKKSNLEKALNFYSLWFKWIAKNMEDVLSFFFYFYISFISKCD